MWELTLLGLFLGMVLVLWAAISRHRLLRMAGLGMLLLVAAGGLALTLGLVGLAVQTPRTDGLARYGLLFLSIPASLLTWLAFRFFVICRRYDPYASPESSVLAGVPALLARMFGRPP